jgi:tetratricopeptide (TPR) repeat protein
MEGLVKVLFRLAEYYTEVSLYEQSLAACYQCEQIIQREGGHLRQFLARVYTDLGMNYTTIFRYEQARQHFLQAKAALEADPTLLEADFSIYPGKRTMATILHYLGRIAEAEGNAQDAMYYYVEGHRYQSMCPEELSASAFYHVRLGELLTSANLLEQARYHIEASQNMFDAIQFSSSGRVLVGLAWASLYEQEGNYRRAKQYIKLAHKEARAKQFPRGELLCLVKLFWLDVRHGRIASALYTLCHAIITWYRGERQHAGLQLLKKYAMQVLVTPVKLFRRSPHSVMGAKTFNAPLTCCICPVHKSKVQDEG